MTFISVLLLVLLLPLPALSAPNNAQLNEKIRVLKYVQYNMGVARDKYLLEMVHGAFIVVGIGGKTSQDKVGAAPIACSVPRWGSAGATDASQYRAG